MNNFYGYNGNFEDFENKFIKIPTTSPEEKVKLPKITKKQKKNQEKTSRALTIKKLQEQSKVIKQQAWAELKFFIAQFITNNKKIFIFGVAAYSICIPYVIIKFLIVIYKIKNNKPI
jgi:hypothetical protein